MTDAGPVTPLVERLGLPAGTRALIVNCDDLGAWSGVNSAAFDLLRHGAATSATLMVPCPAARDAADEARADPVLRDSIGVHLTLTAEWPTYRWASLTGAPVLRADDGGMHRTVAEVHAAVRAAGAAGLDQVRDECRAQIAQAVEWGLDPTHLDSHMGTLQIDQDLLEVYLEVAAEHRLPVRMMSTRTEQALGVDGRCLATELGVLTTDAMLFTYRGAAPIIERVVGSLRPGVTEVLLHPSDDGELLQREFDDADERVANAAFARAGGTLQTLIADTGAVPISYRPLRGLMRRGAIASPATSDSSPER
jgi:predicted glycoside hydrolase/deacetylase ChbG (UPF0249 family)